MSTDLTIGYIVHDGSYAVVEDRTFVARCSNRQQAERVRAALSAADELAAMKKAHRMAVRAAALAYQALLWRGPNSLEGGERQAEIAMQALGAAGITPVAAEEFAAASPTTADHPYSLSLPEGASIHVPCCDLPQSRHPSLGAPFSPTTADGGSEP